MSRLHQAYLLNAKEAKALAGLLRDAGYKQVSIKRCKDYVCNIVHFFAGMKSLYNETDNTHTVDAHALEERAHRAIGPVFESFVKLGYSPREISHEILSVVFEIELETVLASRTRPA